MVIAAGPPVVVSPVVPVLVGVPVLVSAPVLVDVPVLLVPVVVALVAAVVVVSVGSVVAAGLAGHAQASSARTEDVETSEPRCCMEEAISITPHATARATTTRNFPRG